VLGVDATVDLFVPLFETKEEFEQHVSKSATDTSDPIVMAERVKRDIEEKARMEEERARRAFAEHDALTVGAEYDPQDIIDDMTAYYAELDAANATLNRLSAASETYRTVMASVEEAKEALAGCDVAKKEKLIENERAAYLSRREMSTDAGKQIEELHDRIKEFEEEIKKLDRKIEQIEKGCEQRNSENKAAERLVHSIQAELDSLEGYKNIVAQSQSVKPVDADELLDARQTVDALRSKQDRSAIAKENKRKQDSVKEILQRAESLRDNAAHLRDTARRCDVILTELIGTDSPLRIVDGRMIVDTERGETFYADLSDGERWKTAFATVAQHVHNDPGRIAVITIPQIGWESLDPTNQRFVAELSKQYKINVVTAEATDGELTVEKIA
jgi:prefoldin subunit 5